MQRVLAQRGVVVFAALAGSVLLAATLVTSAFTAEAPMRAHVTVSRPDPAGADARVAAAPAEPAKVQVRVVRYDASERAERHVRELRDQAHRTSDPQQRRQLLLASEAEAEKVAGVGEPAAVNVLPSRGLVLVCEKLEPVQQRCVETLRRMGRVDGIDVTVVYTGKARFDDWLRENRSRLGAVFVVADPAGEFRRTHDVNSPTAVVCLRADGRVAFQLAGAPPRERIDARLAHADVRR